MANKPREGSIVFSGYLVSPQPTPPLAPQINHHKAELLKLIYGRDVVGKNRPTDGRSGFGKCTFLVVL